MEDVSNVGFFKAWNTTSQILLYDCPMVRHGLALKSPLMAVCRPEYRLPDLEVLLNLQI